VHVPRRRLRATKTFDPASAYDKAARQRGPAHTFSEKDIMTDLE
jgi:hypothetical protein